MFTGNRVPSLGPTRGRTRLPTPYTWRVIGVVCGHILATIPCVMPACRSKYVLTFVTFPTVSTGYCTIAAIAVNRGTNAAREPY